MSRWIVGITGASGTIYARRLIEVLSTIIDNVDVILSPSAIRVLREEEDIIISGAVTCEALFNKSIANVTFHNSADIGGSVASGSYKIDGMVIVPCSMSTLGVLAHGMSNHLVHRAADVTLKEGRPLIIVPRETPLTVMHLENMLKLARVGVKVIPAMPGFYAKPKDIAELVDMMVMKILDSIGVNSPDLVKRWR